MAQVGEHCCTWASTEEVADALHLDVEDLFAILDGDIDVVAVMVRSESGAELLGVGRAQREEMDGLGAMQPPESFEEPRASGKSVVVWRYHVYRLLDADARVLYVGVTRGLDARLRTHRRRWGHLIASDAVETYDDPGEALAREAELILELAPPFNADGHDGQPRRPRWAP